MPGSNAAMLMALLMLSSLVGRSVSAQAPDDQYQAARVRFEHGERAFESGDFAGALAAWREAIALMEGHPNQGMVHFNIGRAHEELGRVDEARAAYRRFLAEAPTGSPNRTLALERIAVLEPDVEGADAGGVHPSVVGPIVLGIGAVTLVTGLVVGGIAWAQGQDFLAQCPTQSDCPESLRSGVQGMHDMGVAADVLWISGAAIAATGLLLTFLLTEEAESRVSLQLLPATDGGMALLSGALE